MRTMIMFCAIKYLADEKLKDDGFITVLYILCVVGDIVDCIPM